jgi:hypothetical protein
MRDEFKLKIDQQADELIQELERYELECKSNLSSMEVMNESKKISANLNRIGQEMEILQRTLSGFEPNKAEWKLIEQKSHSHTDELRVEMSKYEEDFLLKNLDDYRMKLISFGQIEIQSDRM